MAMETELRVESSSIREGRHGESRLTGCAVGLKRDGVPLKGNLVAVISK